MRRSGRGAGVCVWGGGGGGGQYGSKALRQVGLVDAVCFELFVFIIKSD